ncbi:hypothetical protein CMK12_13595 [Candidatus Poribacteria bacterium]|nr:hypothetical protein [Candidatus Poribacteria bacterium]MDP6597110.1 MerR family transcriptional regulator [Candidatus Poribacteria bacterium]MDP6747868.1 MerR family transcriptional regulator [Candidatus Poribacteria bacterium]MDP6997297.1 MerR family transcriptional regulator [Candidatus Poribacteria bacterium]
MKQEKRYPIKYVSRRTGLSQHVMRAWENRYNVVIPQRSPTNRRLYSEEDIKRLSLCHQATKSGHSIGQIYRLATEEIQELVESHHDNLDKLDTEGIVNINIDKSSARFHLDSCLRSIRRLDEKELGVALATAAMTLSRPVLIEQVITPLMEETGDLWSSGLLRISHEHLSVVAVRTLLGSILSGFNPETGSPVAIVTTPSAQIHELGALAVAIALATEGWRVTYLGANMPVEEIAGAIHQNNAKLLLLSLTYPPDDAQLKIQLSKLPDYIPEETKVIVGGRSAVSYDKVIQQIGAVRIENYSDLRDYTRELRNQTFEQD